MPAGKREEEKQERKRVAESRKGIGFGVKNGKVTWREEMRAKK